MEMAKNFLIQEIIIFLLYQKTKNVSFIITH